MSSATKSAVACLSQGHHTAKLFQFQALHAAPVAAAEDTKSKKWTKAVSTPGVLKATKTQAKDGHSKRWQAGD